MTENTTQNLNNMTPSGIENRTKALEGLTWLTVLAYMVISISSFYKVVVYSHLVSWFIWIPAVTVIVLCAGNRIYSGRRLYAFCLIFILWIVLTCWIHGDFTIDDINSRTFIISRGVMLFTGLSFVHIFKDSGRRHLDAFLSVTVILIAVCLWICYAGILRGENIVFFDGKFVFGAAYTYTDRMMLQLMNLHYYKTAYTALLCFFATLYLAVSHWSKKRSVLFILLMATFLTAVIITYSRTAFIALLTGLMIALLILLQELNISRKVRIVILTACSAGGLVIAAAAMNMIYRYFNSIRDIWYGISTLSSRTTIWASVSDLAGEQPLSLIYGLSLTDSMSVMNSYIGLPDQVSTMHSGYLQALVCFGIPALAAVIAFCIYVLTASLKLLSGSGQHKYPAKVKMMTIIPLCYIIMNLVESLLISTTQNTDLLNLLFFMFSGYILEYAFTKNN